MKSCLLLFLGLSFLFHYANGQQLSRQNSLTNYDSLYLVRHGDTASAGHKQIKALDGSFSEGEMFGWKRQGCWNGYYADGKKSQESCYQDGKCQQRKVYDEEGTLKSDMPVPDTGATYPGGNAKWGELVHKAILAKIEELTWAHSAGTVVIGFIVEKDGSLDQISILKGIDRTADKLSISIAKSSPPWIPATQDGVAVADYKIEKITYSFDLGQR
jgi:hypothetical protein